MRHSALKALLLVLGLAIAGGVGYYLYNQSRNSSDTEIQINPNSSLKSATIPSIKVETVADGLNYPWDVDVSGAGDIIYTERGGTVGIVRDGKPTVIATIKDVRATGEGGLMGMTLDPEFVKNHQLYVCFNAKAASYNDVRVVRFKINDDFSGLSDRSDIVTGMPSNESGRHSGCRPRFGADGNLWIGTGDTAKGSVAQDPESLGGKVLRVDKNGKSVVGNMGSPFDGRIFSYGHRNVQGLAMPKNPRSDRIYGYSIEHGPDRDDEVNALVKGNFGWDPVPGAYNEAVSMTDTNKFPGAIRALWSSGATETIAPSGAAMLEGENWKGWNGALAMAVLKGQHIQIFTFDDNGAIKNETEILDNYGRIRSVVQAPDGSLYVTTDNGKQQDKILKLTPQ